MDKKSVKKNKNFYPAALSVSGSDSGGGSGIQADLRTFNAFGVYGTTAITAVAAQNHRQIRNVVPIPPAALAAQIAAVMDSYAVKCCKSGTLASAENAVVLAEAVKKYQLTLVYSSAKHPCDDEAFIAALDSKLLPLAAWMTLELPEAGALLDRQVSAEDMPECALKLYEKYGASIILHGGCTAAAGGLKRCSDIICRQNRLYRLSTLAADLPAGTAHGAGSTFSAALCALLAVNAPWKEAVCAAKAFVMGALMENVNVGNGVYAMYPPEMNYMDNVNLEELN